MGIAENNINNGEINFRIRNMVQIQEMLSNVKNDLTVSSHSFFNCQTKSPKVQIKITTFELDLCFYIDKFVN